jgi:predicted amidohydrolase
MNNKSLQIASLQLPTLGMSSNRLKFYIEMAYKRDVKLLLFGEFVLNHFFKELKTMPKSMIKEQTKRNIEILKEFAIKYNIIFIAPIITIKKKRFYKEIAKISSSSILYYKQQILISYPHWNEQNFFANPIKPLKRPMSFMIDGIKVAVMAGFELHFNYFWDFIIDKKVDLVLIPTASTFESHNRWRDIIKTKAFLHNCYILRANRLGEYIENGISWKFYGDSMLVNPLGEIEMVLEDTESMLIEKIKKSVVISNRRDWGFQREIKRRERV